MAQEVVAVRGISGSGKSTRALEILKQRPGFKRVNKDLIRLMMDNGWTGDRRTEDFIHRISIMLIRQALMDGYSVVVDDTNLKTPNFLMKLAWEWGAMYSEEIMKTPFKICMERNAKRTGSEYVPEDAMYKQYNRVKKEWYG